MDHSQGRKIIISTAAIAGAIVLLIVYLIYRSFESYEVKSESVLSDSERTSYGEFAGNVICYNRDGASCLDYDGNLLWTASFEMGSPVSVIRGDYLLIYDRGGIEMDVFYKDGSKKVISVNLPISVCDVSANGASACLMTDEGTSTHVINVYTPGGELMAGGELHTENTGYPIEIALSADGAHLIASVLDLSGGSIKTTLQFYDFSSGGSDKTNHIVQNVSFSDMVVPYVYYFDDGRAGVFGDDEIIIFSADAKPVIAKEIFESDRIESVCTSGGYFAVVTGGKLNVFGSDGGRLFSTDCDMTYTDMHFLSNNEIYMTDGENVELITLYGVRKFSHRFDGGIAALLPWDGGTNYIIVSGGKLLKVQLK